jgi:hypothetical protein
MSVSLDIHSTLRVSNANLHKPHFAEHRVCQEQQMDHISGTIAFPTLEKGSKFITNFGVVEVISDDRASSSYKYPENIKTESKNYASYKEKQGVAQRKLYMTYGFHSRLRRMRLMRTYLDGNVTQESTEKAYFGISWLKNFHTELPAPEERVDPLHPSDAHPDRIVVCKLVNDERLRVQPHDDDGNDTEEGTTIKALSSPDATLYLRRRDLTKSYNPEVMIRICPYCGENKSSKEGYKYHLDKQVCVKKAGIRLQQRSEVQNAIENRLHTHIRRHSTRHKKKRIEDAVYPQVWMFLRFSVPPARRAPVEEANDVLLTESRVTKLDETLESLKVQLLRHGALERDRKYGAMYPQVFEALSFSKLANPGTVKRQRRTARLKAEAKLKLQLKREVECLLGGSEEKEDETIDTDDENLEDMEGVAIDSNADVPIIDIQVLIDEAKSGRYPSIQLFEGDHPEFCGLCKEGGELFLCDFCSTAVHFDCLLKKIIVKEPEPEEDFMCHNCARTLMTRRNRAEKRRVQKQEAVIARAGSEKCITPNSHHKNVALSGRELSELMELLDDAKNRLQQISETSKVNSLRRLQIG